MNRGRAGWLRRRRAARVAIGVLVLAVAGPAAALDTPNERVTLAGLTRLHVVVDELSPDAEREGLTRAALQAEVERRLQQAGLRVLGGAEALAADGRPTLHVRVEVARIADLPDLFLYSVDLTLRQRTWLARDRKIESHSITWSDTRQVGAVRAGRIGAVRDAVRAKVEQFLKAWETVNRPY